MGMVSMKGYLRRNVARVLLALLLATSLVALFPWAAVPAHVGAATVIDEFPIPTAGGSPYAIAAGADGALWFTEFNGNNVGRITISGQITQYPIPTQGSVAYGMTAGPDGNIWFVGQIGNQIGRVTPAGVITEFPIPTPASAPLSITTGPDGALWFTEGRSSANKIGRITISGQITEFPLPTANRQPVNITTGPDGNLWFTESADGGNAIGRLSMTATPSPSPSSSPSPSPSTSPSPPPASFGDLPSGYWAAGQIAQFAARGITTGCGDDGQGGRAFCPERGVTRAEMATFIMRTLGQNTPTPPVTPTFADVPTGYWAYAQIEAFAQLGITTGCGTDELGRRVFCPERGVTRAEMAVFIDRAKGQTELRPATPTFADVQTSYWAYGWVERFFTLGVTTGCGEDEQGRKVYCPDRGVTRAEMAVFIIRAYP